MKKIFSILFIFLLVACTPKEVKKYNQAVDNTAKIDQITEIIADQVETHIIESRGVAKNWINHYKKYNPDFSLSKFESGEALPFDLVKSHFPPAIYESGFNQNFKPFLVYNKDKTQYIQIDNWEEENGEFFYPTDQYISLVDLNTKQSFMLATYGPSHWVEDVFWENDTTIVFLANDTEQKPTITKIDLTNKKKHFFYYPEIVEGSNSYTKKRISRILHQNLPVSDHKNIDLPQGYTEIESIQGDLNQDKTADFVFLAEKKEDTKNKGRFGMVVYLSTNEGYELVYENATLFKDNMGKDGYRSTDEINFRIENNRLFIQNSIVNQGAKNVETLSFRWQGNHFELIGFDKSTPSDFLYDKEPNLLLFNELSMNFLTYKKQTKTVIGFDEKNNQEIFNEQWENLEKKPRLKLNQIKEFEHLVVQDLYPMSKDTPQLPQEMRNAFWKNVDRLKTATVSEGEDATSIFFTKFYYHKSDVKLIRNIWNGGAGNPPTTFDVYLNRGELVLVEEYENKALAGKFKDVEHFEKDKNTGQRTSYVIKNNQIVTAYLDKKENVLDKAEKQQIIQRILAGKAHLMQQFNDTINP